jgi:hypothetical protein
VADGQAHGSGSGTTGGLSYLPPDGQRPGGHVVVDGVVVPSYQTRMSV